MGTFRCHQFSGIVWGFRFLRASETRERARPARHRPYAFIRPRAHRLQWQPLVSHNSESGHLCRNRHGHSFGRERGICPKHAGKRNSQLACLKSLGSEGVAPAGPRQFVTTSPQCSSLARPSMRRLGARLAGFSDAAVYRSVGRSLAACNYEAFVESHGSCLPRVIAGGLGLLRCDSATRLAALFRLAS